MATIPAPATWTDGPKITAAKLNLEVRDVLRFFLTPPQVKASLATTAITTATSVWTPVTLNSEDWDTGPNGVTDAMHANTKGSGAAATYTWVANVVTVTLTAHELYVGQTVYVDFTSGGGTPDGLYTVATRAANTFTFALTGSGAAGNCTIDIGVSRLICVTPGLYAVNAGISFAGSGTGERQFSVRKNSVGRTVTTATSTYTWVANVVTVTTPSAFGITTGDRVYLDFTSGGGTPDGTYVVASTPTVTSFTVALTGAGAAGNVTLGQSVFTSNVTATSVTSTNMSKAFDARLVAGDYLELVGLQNTGGALDINFGAEETFLSMRFEAV